MRKRTDEELRLMTNRTDEEHRLNRAAGQTEKAGDLTYACQFPRSLSAHIAPDPRRKLTLLHVHAVNDLPHRNPHEESVNILLPQLRVVDLRGHRSADQVLISCLLEFSAVFTCHVGVKRFRGLREFWKSCGVRMIDVPVDDAGVRLDVDTPEDYRRCVEASKLPSLIRTDRETEVSVMA